jgi:hypothetical protein
MSFNALPSDPWRSFLQEIDEALDEPLSLHCIGGFPLTVRYNLPRPTEDIDLIEVPPSAYAGPLLMLGGEGGPLHKKYKLYIDPVTVAYFPENYADRLTEVFAGVFTNLRILVLDPYDIALTKLGRNNQKDRDDMRFLARTVPFKVETLRERYFAELQWQYAEGRRYGPRYRANKSFEEWIEMIEEDRMRSGGMS